MLGIYSEQVRCVPCPQGTWLLSEKDKLKTNVGKVLKDCGGLYGNMGGSGIEGKGRVGFARYGDEERPLSVEAEEKPATSEGTSCLLNKP